MLGGLFACEFGSNGEGKVDACGDTAAGDAVAVFDNAICGDFNAQVCELVAEEPVGGGFVAIEQSGGGEDEGAGADGGDVLGGLGLMAEEVEGFGVGHLLGGAEVAAGNADEVELGAVGKSSVGLELEARHADNGFSGFGDEVDLAVGEGCEDLVGAGEVELGEVGVEEKADLVRHGGAEFFASS